MFEAIGVSTIFYCAVSASLNNIPYAISIHMGEPQIDFELGTELFRRNYCWNFLSNLPEKRNQSKKLLNWGREHKEERCYIIEAKTKILKYCLNNLNTSHYENDDLVVKTWNPFKDDVIGFGAYKDSESNYKIKQIYRNQTRFNIDMTNLELAGYIPHDFLKKLSQNKPKEDLENVAVQMVLILNADKIRGYWSIEYGVKYLIGVSIRNSCSQESTPYLTMYSKYGRNESPIGWLDFGNPLRYYHFEDVEDFCDLSRIVFVGQINANDYFHSVVGDYCRCYVKRFQIDYNSGNSLCARYYKQYFPRKICFDDKFNLLHLNCRLSKFFASTHTCQNVLAQSNQTELYYKALRNCAEMALTSSCVKNVNNIANDATKYSDIIIGAQSYRQIQDDILKNDDKFKLYCKLMHKGLLVLGKEVEESQISGLLPLFQHEYIFLNRSYTLEANSVFTYMQFRPYVFKGFIIYESDTSPHGYEVELLNRKNATLNYRDDKRVSAIIYIISNQLKDYDICTLVVIYNNLTEHTNQTSKSDVVVAYCYYDNAPLLNVYIKSKDTTKKTRKEYYLNEGYSISLSLNSRTRTILHIFELKNSICDPISKLAIFQFKDILPPFGGLFDLERSPRNHYGNKTIRNIDLISHIITAVDEQTQEDHSRHFIILKIITFILSSLSLAGSLAILISALIFKNWYKQRPYSVQLTLSITGGTIFFLISEGSITQIGYIIFYYLLLSQFVWMLIIGYIQYIRYVKVFEAYELNVFRTSLVGWILPIAITSISILTHLQCFQCSNFCSQNRDILMYFFIIPISIIVITNTALYAYVMVVIARSGTEMFEPEARKARTLATIFLLSIMGITWIFFGLLFIPSKWVSIIGSYIFHVVAASQGLVVFIFVIVIDEVSRKQWCTKFVCITTCNRTPASH